MVLNKDEIHQELCQVKWSGMQRWLLLARCDVGEVLDGRGGDSTCGESILDPLLSHLMVGEVLDGRGCGRDL